ncbi:MAG: lactate utilization protein [Pseudomonadota bacterium]|nr:lactate utilization protein [Pseudomonadota bacterium]
MSRETVLGTIRRSLGVTGQEAGRRVAVEERLTDAPRGVIPARGQLPPEARLDLFRSMAEAVNATVDRVPSAGDVPAALAAFLRAHNLPPQLRRGDDPFLASLPWDTQPTLEISTGPATGDLQVGLSRAYGAVAESGTLVLLSGPENPSTINFLPETHVVVVLAEDVAPDYESVWGAIRARYGKGRLPRTVNMITGPSRSADIEQTLLLGAHGPRHLHIILVGGPPQQAGSAPPFG